MKSDPHRLHHLFGNHSDGTITPAEHAELQDLLRQDPAARRLWFVHQDVDDGLHEIVQTTATGEPHRPARSRWLQWQPLTAAAAGLVIGLFSASMVFAYAVPRLQPWVENVLPLTDAGFEAGTAPAPDGIPLRFALWSGDFTESTPAQQGISPKEGNRMLRFLRADSTVSPEAEKSMSGNLYQVVDMRPWRNEIAGGQATVDWSAWYNWVPGKDEKGMQFMTNVWAFTGTTEILPRNWKEHLYQETAKSSHRITVDDAPRTWRQTAGRMTLPADTDFLVIELKIIPSPSASVTVPYQFSGCFADDVRMLLRSHAPQHLAAHAN